jgi:flagellar protein FlgJ
MDYEAINPAVKAQKLTVAIGTVDQSQKSSSSLQVETLEPFYGWSDAESFVMDLWPHAEKAADKLGVSASLLVAQSALETGWGRHAMKKSDGSIAYNLFGIKAGQDWYGASVTHNTLEHREGVMQQERSQFRAYDSVAEALDDYVNFIQSRSRYQQALQHGGSDEHYINSLQEAGYATDPAYAEKVMDIMSGQTFNQTLAVLNMNDGARVS